MINIALKGHTSNMKIYVTSTTCRNLSWFHCGLKCLEAVNNMASRSSLGFRQIHKTGVRPQATKKGEVIFLNRLVMLLLQLIKIEGAKISCHRPLYPIVFASNT
jgi:hypothetical protein